MTINGSSGITSPIIQPSGGQDATPSLQTGNRQVAPGQSSSTGVIAGNSSGLLQNFILSRGTLEGVGLRTPRNSGDTEVLLAEITLIFERLEDENDSRRAENHGEAFRVRAQTFAAFQTKLAELSSEIGDSRRKLDIEERKAARLDEELEPLTEERNLLQATMQQLNTHIADLDRAIAMPGQPDATIAELQRQRTVAVEQLRVTQAEFVQVENKISPLLAEKQSTAEEISRLSNQIAEDSKARRSLESALEVIASNFALLSAQGAEQESLDEAQEHSDNEEVEDQLEDILPQFQHIIDTTVEDVEIRDFISKSDLDEAAANQALKAALGLLGSFYESLGVFLQLADLFELDLDMVARANNKQQRLQVAL